MQNGKILLKWLHKLDSTGLEYGPKTSPCELPNKFLGLKEINSLPADSPQNIQQCDWLLFEISGSDGSGYEETVF